MIPDYVFSTTIWFALLTNFLFALFSALFFSWIIVGSLSSRFRATRWRHLATIAFAFSLVGMVAGQITGLSREPAVGAVIPAILTLVGSLALYLIGVKSVRTHIITSTCVIALTVNLLVGIYWGSKSRSTYDEWAQSPEVIFVRAYNAENVRHRVAVQRLLNNIQFERLRSDLKKKWGVNVPRSDAASISNPVGVVGTPEVP